MNTNRTPNPTFKAHQFFGRRLSWRRLQDAFLWLTGHRFVRSAARALTMVSACVVVLTPTGVLGRQDPSWAPGEILVQFQPETPEATARSTHDFVGAQAVQRFPHVRVDRVRVPEGWTEQETAALYRLDPDVAYAEPNYTRQGTALPDDTRFGLQWALNNVAQMNGIHDADIDGPEAWDTTTGSTKVIVAILDTGVDLDHKDLSPNIWRNTQEDWTDGHPGHNGIDDDHNGKVDDYTGWDFVNKDNDPNDDSDGHGTHVAGIIGARGNNALGITGLCWQVSIMPLKILGAAKNGLVSDEIAAIDYAIANGARVINASLGGPTYSELERSAIERARNAGVLFVAAAGNGGTDNDLDPVYPAGHGLSNVISVAATDPYDDLSATSNYGVHSVDVAAPGVSILSTNPENGYAYRSGTSMATAYVAGLAALVWSASPTLTAAEVKDDILGNVDLLPSLQGKVGSGGRINAYGSLHPSNSSKSPSSPSTGASNGSGGGGGCFVTTLVQGMSIFDHF